MRVRMRMGHTSISATVFLLLSPSWHSVLSVNNFLLPTVWIYFLFHFLLNMGGVKLFLLRCLAWNAINTYHRLYLVLFEPLESLLL